MDLEYQLIIPEFVMAGLAVVIIAAALAFRNVDQKWFGYATAVGLAIIAIITAVAYWDTNDDFGGVLAVDHFTVLFRVFFLGIAFFTVMAAVQFAGDRLKNHAEFYGLIVFATLGMMLLAASRELLTAYLSLELLSFSFYILVGFNKLNPFSNEGSLKYMLLGAFSSALMLYGISLIYGVTGTTTYSAIGPDVAEGTRNIAEQLASFAGGSGGVDPDGARPGLLIGLVLITAGLGFKVSAVPFHQWTPDAYQGAPLPITAFLSAGGKAAAFAFFLRLFSEAFLPAAAEWVWFVAILAAVTMIVGNLMALQQTNFKRLMAYSSISQVGYLLVGIVALDAANIGQSQDAASALVLHLIGYVTTNIAVFAAIIAFYNRTGRDDIVDLRGLAERQPFLAFAIAAALFLVSRDAAVRRVRDQVHHLPGRVQQRLPLARRDRCDGVVRFALLLPDGDQADVPLRARRLGPRALPRVTPAGRSTGRAGRRRALHRALPDAAVRRHPQLDRGPVRAGRGALGGRRRKLAPGTLRQVGFDWSNGRSSKDSWDFIHSPGS